MGEEAERDFVYTSRQLCNLLPTRIRIAEFAAATQMCSFRKPMLQECVMESEFKNLCRAFIIISLFLLVAQTQYL